MAQLYSSSQLGIKEPAGGFKDLGWYDGYQYYGGTFASRRGMIHPNSPQAGAGQLVSEEVNRQSAAAQNKSVPEFQNYLNGNNSSGSGNQGGSNGGSSASSGSGMPTIATKPSIDLNSLYEQLFNTPEFQDLNKKIADVDAEIQKKLEAKNASEAGTNDNPFYAESTRVGKISKTREAYNNDVTALTNQRNSLANDLAKRKADAEVKLNLQLKQYDINRQEYKDTLEQFSALVSAGAFQNASGEDIGKWAAATGFSTAMIDSIVQKQKTDDIKTSVINSTADDGTVTVSIIDTQTGRVISQQNLGKIGNAQNGSGGSTKINEAEVKASLVNDVRNKMGVKDIFSVYGEFLDANDILRLYNANSPWGPAKESAKELQQLGVDTSKFGYDPLAK